MDAELQKALLKKAGALLARRAYSRGELRIRLARIAEDSQIESVLNRLEQLNLLNDADYAYNFALCRIQREGWGPAKVRESLIRRHLPQATIESALERVLAEMEDDSVLIEYIKRHYGKQALPTAPKDIQKLVLHLLRRGFGEDAIFNALKRLIPAAALRHFETGE
jgi:regulatory protein